MTAEENQVWKQQYQNCLNFKPKTIQKQKIFDQLK